MRCRGSGSCRRFVLKNALNYNAVVAAIPVLILILLTTPSTAQSPSTPPEGSWRPKDGIYAAPGKDFAASCDAANNIAIELGGKSVSGNEWSCRVTKIFDLDSNSI